MASSKKDINSSVTKPKQANCIIVRAKETNEECLKNIQSILPHFEPIILKKYGNEYTEKEELISKYNMPQDLCEIGKFYDHEGSHLWYYYVYGQLTRSKEVKELKDLKENVIASQLLNRGIYGDIAIVRSGPTTSNIDPWLSMDKLAQTVIFYETHDPKMVFGDRERKRFFEKLGMKDQCPILSCVIGFDYD